MSFDKELLFKPRLAEQDVEIPDVGTVRIRALSRAEAMIVQGAGGVEAMERKMVHFGMADPVMTEAEVGRWMKASPAGELQALANRITELSGMTEGAAKAAYKSDGGGPDAGVRDVPGAEAVQDGGPAAADE